MSVVLTTIPIYPQVIPWANGFKAEISGGVVLMAFGSTKEEAIVNLLKHAENHHKERNEYWSDKDYTQNL